MLEKYLPNGLIDKDEMDLRYNLRPTWRKLTAQAETVADGLGALQAGFKRQLVSDVGGFAQGARDFAAAFARQGPGADGVRPAEGKARLSAFGGQLADLEQRRDQLGLGEELFGLKRTRFPELLRVRREVDELTLLYTLHADGRHLFGLLLFFNPFFFDLLRRFLRA